MRKIFINLSKVIAGLASASAGVVKKGHEILEDTYFLAVGDREIAKLLTIIHDNNELHQTEYKKIKKEYKYVDSAVISGLFLPQMTGWFRFNQTKELSKEVFEAYAVDDEFRELIDSRRYAELGVHSSGEAFKNLPVELKQSIPAYIRENVNLERLENVR